MCKKKHLLINVEKLSNLEEISHLLPQRKSNNGTRPTMSSITAKWNPRDQWEFPEGKVSEAEKQILVGTVYTIVNVTAINRNKMMQVCSTFTSRVSVKNSSVIQYTCTFSRVLPK